MVCVADGTELAAEKLERTAGGSYPVDVTRVEPHGLLAELFQPVAESSVSPQPVDRAAARRGHQPGARIPRQAVDRPVLERGDGRLLDELLGKVPVAQDADQRGDQSGALLTQDRVEGNVDGVALGQSNSRERTARMGGACVNRRPR